MYSFGDCGPCGWRRNADRAFAVWAVAGASAISREEHLGSFYLGIGIVLWKRSFPLGRCFEECEDVCFWYRNYVYYYLTISFNVGTKRTKISIERCVSNLARTEWKQTGHGRRAGCSCVCTFRVVLECLRIFTNFGNTVVFECANAEGFRDETRPRMHVAMIWLVFVVSML